MLEKDRERLVDTYREIVLSKIPDITNHDLEGYLAAFITGMGVSESYYTCGNIETVETAFRMVNELQTIVN